MAPRRAYGVDDLLKLRPIGKQQSEQDDEVVRKISSEAGIRDHVLRSSVNTSDPSNLRSRNRTASIATTQYEGYELPPNDNFVLRGKPSSRSFRHRSSPTPSVKRGKAERLLEEHGSPPRVRVTAGGRIVPDTLSPITSPRFNKSHATQMVTRLDPQKMPDAAALQGVNGLLVSLNGQMCQVVNGQIAPLQPTANGGLALYMEPLNPYTAIAPNAVENSIAPQPSHSSIQEFAPNTDLNDLASCKASLSHMEMMKYKLDEDLKALDRSEALCQGREILPRETKRAIVQQRISLVNRIDECRTACNQLKKVIEALQKDMTRKPFATDLMNAHHHANENTRLSTANLSGQVAGQPATANIPLTLAHPSYNSAYSYAMSNALQQQPFGYGAMPSQFMPTFPGAPPVYGAVHSNQNTPGNDIGLGIQTNISAPDNENIAPSNPVKALTQMMENLGLDGSARTGRRSHAIKIKCPSEASQPEKSGLNPRSPSYQPPQLAPKDDKQTNGPPPFRTDGAPSFATTTASTLSLREVPNNTPRAKPVMPHSATNSTVEKVTSHEGSDCSADTADFFPYNPREYSSTRRETVEKRGSNPAQAPTAQTNTSSGFSNHKSENVAPMLSPSKASQVAGSTTVSGTLDQREARLSASSQVASPARDTAHRSSSSATHLGEPAAYSRGFQHGLVGTVDTFSGDVNYLRGWRDGTLASKDNRGMQEPVTSVTQTQKDKTSASNIPSGSANSASGDRHPSASPRHRDYTHSVEKAFQSRANISVGSTEHSVGTQTYTPGKQETEQLSPLSQRHVGHQTRVMSSPVPAMTDSQFERRLPSGVEMGTSAALPLVSPGLAGHYDGSGSGKHSLHMALDADQKLSPVRANGSPACRPTTSPLRVSPVRSPSKRITSTVLSAVGLKERAASGPALAEPESPTKKSRNWRERLGQLSPKSALKHQ